MISPILHAQSEWPLLIVSQANLRYGCLFIKLCADLSVKSQSPFQAAFQPCDFRSQFLILAVLL
jgi:hypothetical protein